jgi:hypothetical protein
MIMTVMSGSVNGVFRDRIELRYNNVIVSDRVRTSFRGIEDRNTVKEDRTEVRYSSNKVFACTSLFGVENFVVFC